MQRRPEPVARAREGGVHCRRPQPGVDTHNEESNGSEVDGQDVVHCVVVDASKRRQLGGQWLPTAERRRMTWSSWDQLRVKRHVHPELSSATQRRVTRR
ncbi:hypothetical protein ACFPRL_29205 [Pseudoclavibacter helvolus]